jgi:hypothetical protein
LSEQGAGDEEFACEAGVVGIGSGEALVDVERNLQITGA